jgi:hypothetical protein
LRREILSMIPFSHLVGKLENDFPSCKTSQDHILLSRDKSVDIQIKSFDVFKEMMRRHARPQRRRSDNQGRK